MKFEFEPQSAINGVFKLYGSLIGETDGMPLTEAFNEQMENGFLIFILDLSELKHINSSGLGVFITLLTKARKKDGELLLVNPSEGIRKLLLMTKLTAIFKIYDTVAEALEA
jgi:anti-sigma B factor antagonist